MKHCEWDEWSINQAAFKGNLEMLKYCFSNECPCDEEKSCTLAAKGGHLDCLRLLRQSETFARYGKRSGNKSGRKGSHRHREISC